MRKTITEGAWQILPRADHLYGHRAGRVRDPHAHHWVIAQQLQKVSDEQLVNAFEELCTNES